VLAVVHGAGESFPSIARAASAWYNGDTMTRRELRREVEELRGLLGLTKPRTIEEWEALPQVVRDPLAARAWIAEWGDAGRALVRLGFPAMNRLPPDQVRHYHDHAARVFGTPGVQAILKRDLARPDVEREAVFVRAAALLAKVCGWEFRGEPSSPVPNELSVPAV